MHPASLLRVILSFQPKKEFIWRVHFPASGGNSRSCTRPSGGNGRVERKADAYSEAVRKFLASKIILGWLCMKAFCTLCFLQSPAMYCHGAGPVLHTDMMLAAAATLPAHIPFPSWCFTSSCLTHCDVLLQKWE